MRFWSRNPAQTGTRHDYRKEHCGWGHDITFKNEKRDTYRGHMWSPFRVADRINVGATEDLLLTKVERMRDPDDMYFFTAVPTPASPDEPDSTHRSGDWL